MMTNIISPEILIPLVEERPVIWDKTSDNHKEKDLKSAAWKEICCIINPEFDNLDEKESKDFAKKVTKKWINIWDAFMRSLKNEEKKRTSAGSRPGRPYLYKNELSFLLKIYESRTTRYNEPNDNSSNSCSDATIEHKSPPKKKAKIETKDDKISQFPDKSVEQEHPHVSFIKGVLPSLALFNDEENLEFQAGVLALIQKIKKKRRVSGTWARYGDHSNT